MAETPPRLGTRLTSSGKGSFAILRLIGLLLVRVAILRAEFRALLTFLLFGLFLSILLLRFLAGSPVLLLARFVLVLLLRHLSRLLLGVLLFVSHNSPIYSFEPN
jgi:hypothetical protein